MKKWILVLTACLALPAMAQEDALRDLDGFVDFGELTEVYGEPSVQISLGGALLGFVGAMSESEDPETAELFNSLKGVRVNIYKTDGQVDAATQHVSSVVKLLKKESWEPIVRVNEGDEQVQIFLKMNDTTVEGLTLMAVDGEEAVFINVIGNINPRDLGKVASSFDVDVDDIDLNIGNDK
jgi:hypothetical protein